MSNDEIQRKMDFIIEHQAKHEIEIEDLRSAMTRLEMHQETLTETVSLLIANAEKDRLEAKAEREFTMLALRELANSINSVHNRVSNIEEK